jgi:uncharacterized membrane protein YccC
MTVPSANARLLQQVLTPLLEDFRYWFERSLRLLESEKLDFLSESVQSDLLRRVRQAQQELWSAEMLYTLSKHEVGVDPQLIARWHRLLMECARVSRNYRELHTPSPPSPANTEPPA